MQEAPTTNWSVIRSARGDNPEALRILIESYRSVIVRYFGSYLSADRHRAEDLTQQFIMDKFLVGRFLEHSNQDKGRFRVYLRRAVKNFLIDQYRKDKQLNKVILLSGNFDLGSNTSKGEENDPFNVIWAKNILITSVNKYKDKCKRRNRNDLWIIIDSLLFRPLLNNEPLVDREELVKKLNLRSVRHVNNLLATAKSQFSVIISMEVAKTLDSDLEIEDEIKFLISTLSSE